MKSYSTPGSLRFSRPRVASGFGKNVVPAKTLVTSEARSKAEAAVRAEGYDTLAQFLRDVVNAKAFGITAVRSMHERRIAVLAQIVPEKDQRGGAEAMPHP